MNLLEKANIITTATAYDNGKLHSVKGGEVADFDVVRGSAATRVTAQGLVENVQILSSNLVQNGNFSEEGVQEISNGSFSQEGVQLITNGDFSNGSTGWQNTFGGEWVISGGKATLQTGADGTYLSAVGNILTTGKSYKAVITTSGGLDANNKVTIYANSNTGKSIEADGTHTLYFTANGTVFRFSGVANDNPISIESVSVREVGQDWTLTDGCSIVEQGLRIVSDGTIQDARQNYVVTSGKTYEIEYEITESVSGSLKIVGTFGANLSIDSTVGVHKFYGVAVDPNLNIRRNSSPTDITITNISVKEVGMYWDLGTGWSIAENKAISDATQGYIVQNDISGAGVTATYKVQWTQNITAGTRLRFFARNYNDSGNATTLSITRNDGTSMGGGNCIGSGTFTAYVSSTNGYSFKLLAEAGVEADITNITTIQITDDTNLPRISYENFSYQDALRSEEVVNGGFDTNLNNWVAYSNTLISWESGGYALLNSNNNYWCKIKQDNVFEIGKTYKVTLTAKSNRTDLNFHASPITGSFSQADTFETFDQYYTATTTGFTFGYANAGSATITIDNVSVKEYLGQSVVPNSGCGSWLWEPQSTNTIDRSNFYGAASYHSGLTRTSNAAISPDGTFNAMSFIPTATTGVHRSGYSTTAGSFAQNDIVTFSGFVKANGYDFVAMGGFFGNEKAVFNISNGTLVSQESNVVNTEIVKLTNDWYRLSTTYTFQNTIGNALLYTGIQVMETATGYSFIGDGVSGVYCYGFQAELGTGTSYIPTSGAITTRLADRVTGAGDATTFNSTEGVLYAEMAALADLTAQRWISIGSGGNPNRVSVLFKSATSVSCSVRASSSAVYDANFNIGSTTNNTKVAIRYKSSDYAFFVNGVKVDSQLSGALSFNSPLSELAFDSADGGSKFFGKVKALAVFNEALTDSELECLTKI